MPRESSEKIKTIHVSTPSAITFRWPQIGRTVVTSAGRHTGFWVRLLAGVLDVVVLWIASFILLHIPLVGPFLVWLVSPAYFTYFEGSQGATLGKKVVGIRVVSTDGKNPIGFKRAFIRWVGKVISFLAVGVGFAWIAIDEYKQAWHDKIAKTYVVYSKDRA